MEPQELIKNVVEEALAGHDQEFEVKMMFGELFLFHALLQEFGLALLKDPHRFIPLMERNKARLDKAAEEWRS